MVENNDIKIDAAEGDAVGDFDAAVVVCTYNRYEVLKKCIESLEMQDLNGRKVEIVIVDNSPASKDQEAAQAIYSEDPVVRYHFEKIAGLSNARNVGVQITSAPIICYIDDDAIAKPNWVDEVCNAFETLGPDVGIVGGRILPIWGVPRPVWFTDAMLGSVSVVDLGGETRTLREGEWIAGANFCVRRDVFGKVGGFDTNLGRKGGGQILLSNEEANFKSRANSEGFETGYAPRATVDHLVEVARVSRRFLRSRMAWQALSDIFEDPDKVFGAADKAWRDLQGFYAAMPPHLRNPRGLFEVIESPKLTEMQVNAFYSILVLALNGYEVEGSDRPESGFLK